MKMDELRVGQVLKSYCGGHFGRHFFGGCIEAIGWDWIVARSENGNPAFAHLPGGLSAHQEKIAAWNEYDEESKRG